MDEDTGVFKLVPIANTAQRSIFDSDFQQQNSVQESGNNDSADSNEAEGSVILGLPGSNGEGEIIDGESREVDAAETDPGEDEAGESEKELDDITDELLGLDDSEDGRNYEEQEDGSEE